MRLSMEIFRILPGMLLLLANFDVNVLKFYFIRRIKVFFAVLSAMS